MPHESLPPSPPRYVFVYGTLRRGGLNDITRLTPAPLFVGEAQVAGVLYHLGHYPGLTLGGGGRVRGEVYAITAALEAVLDDIEDLGENPTDEYAKREVAVDVQGRFLQCLVYEINPRYVTTAPRIQHGDWLKA
ncbi:gamma-glutamylcyclotransferase [Acidovorax sp.]|uniref:gamma-glutamylcyclotransferase family protein n=1 Tax=Acidovorax sp. TaxID=1872122 RepID=UPI00391D3F9B